MINLRTASIQLGLLPPETHDLLCGCGADHGHRKGGSSPGINEMIAAMRPHQWPEMREVHRRALRDTMALATKYEGRMLRALGLPGIEETRAAALGLVDPPTSGRRLRFDESDARAMREVILEWLKEYLGADYAGKGGGAPFDPLDFGRFKPIYVRMMMEAFDVSARRTYKDIEAAIEPGGVVAFITADPDLEYLHGMLLEGGRRITTRLAREHFDDVRRTLIEMAAEGLYPIDAAAVLHQQYFEGAAWYWRRITQSEATLAANQAFNHMAAENGAKYEQWQAGAGCCIICGWFDGKVWELGHGPEPVSSTHPYCGCARVATFSPGRPPEASYHRELGSPYDNSWTQAEIDRMRADLQTTRGGTYREP